MKRILVIDDSDVNLYLIKTIFEDYTNIEVLLESDSKNAISLIEQIKPNILLLDLMMPSLDGYQILNLIRSNEKLTKLPIVVISAYLDSKSIKRIEGFGVTYYLSKPIDLERTESLINSILHLS